MKGNAESLSTLQSGRCIQYKCLARNNFLAEQIYPPLEKKLLRKTTGGNMIIVHVPSPSNSLLEPFQSPPTYSAGKGILTHQYCNALP